MSSELAIIFQGILEVIQIGIVKLAMAAECISVQQWGRGFARADGMDGRLRSKNIKWRSKASESPGKSHRWL